jgi:hypothetical protein
LVVVAAAVEPAAVPVAVVEVVPVDYTLQTQEFQNQPELRL